MIPKQVGHDEFLAAITPLFDLIGARPENVVMNAPVSIVPVVAGADVIARLIFAHAPGAPSEGRIDGMADMAHPQGDDHAELVSIVSVDIVLGGTD